MLSSEGSILLIANPAAQNGNGAAAAQRAVGLLRAQLGEDAVVLARTAGPRHASEIAERAEGCSTVIALGGDGVIHEVAGGLMRRPAARRPALGVIPVGSGNDYARTLGVSTKVDEACAQLLGAEARLADVGRVNGHWFVETLSFGLDAAIALDTMERRVRTGRTGTVLYMESGIDQLLHHLDLRRYRVSFDGGETVERNRHVRRADRAPITAVGSRSAPTRASTTASWTCASPIRPSAQRAPSTSSCVPKAASTFVSSRSSCADAVRCTSSSTRPLPPRWTASSSRAPRSTSPWSPPR